MTFNFTHAQTVIKDAAAQHILPRFRNNTAQNLEAKTHSYDVVTQADLEAEAHFKEHLPKLYPGCFVTGEESIAKDPTQLDQLFEADLGFLVDPVDGTLNFSQGLSTFGTIVAVFRKGECVAGLIYDPIVDEWLIGEKGAGTYQQGRHGEQKIQNIPVRTPVFINNTLHHLSIEQTSRLTTNLKNQGILRSFWCSAFDYRLMVLGSATGCLTMYCKPWDHAAGALMLEEVGGHTAFLDGAAYSPKRDVGPLLSVHDKAEFEDIKAKVQNAL